MFESIDFEALHTMKPPEPRNCSDAYESESDASDSSEFQNAEPGLGGQQLSRLLGLQHNDEAVLSPAEPIKPSPKEPPPSNSAPSSAAQSKKSVINFPADEQQLQTRLLHQQETMPQWHNLVDKKLVLKHGLIDKRKVSRILSVESADISRKIVFKPGPLLSTEDVPVDIRSESLLC